VTGNRSNYTSDVTKKSKEFADEDGE